jgi:hypothetical protein
MSKGWPWKRADKATMRRALNAMWTAEQSVIGLDGGSVELSNRVYAIHRHHIDFLDGTNHELAKEMDQGSYSMAKAWAWKDWED